MNNDQFDKELTALYQQRKAKIVSPEIKFNDHSQKNTFSLLRLLAIFFIAGSASFGIMAVVSHFSTLSTSSPKLRHTLQVNDFVELTSPVAEENTIVSTKPLPPMPERNLPLKKGSFKPENEIIQTEVSIDFMDNVEVKTPSLPTLNQPVSVREPVYKELPKYKASDEQPGEINLSYQINKEGRVINIKVLNSNVNRSLERSAKKALSKWRYNNDVENNDELRVVFKFTPEKS